MEIAHNTIVELKVGPRIKQPDIDQLMKYVRAKQACGMALHNAAVICFCTDNTIDIFKVDCRQEFVGATGGGGAGGVEWETGHV